MLILSSGKSSRNPLIQQLVLQQIPQGLWYTIERFHSRHSYQCFILSRWFELHRILCWIMLHWASCLCAQMLCMKDRSRTRIMDHLVCLNTWKHTWYRVPLDFVVFHWLSGYRRLELSLRRVGRLLGAFHLEYIIQKSIQQQHFLFQCLQTTFPISHQSRCARSLNLMVFRSLRVKRCVYEWILMLWAIFSTLLEF